MPYSLQFDSDITVNGDIINDNMNAGDVICIAGISLGGTSSVFSGINWNEVI